MDYDGCIYDLGGHLIVCWKNEHVTIRISSNITHAVAIVLIANKEIYTFLN